MDPNRPEVLERARVKLAAAEREAEKWREWIRQYQELETEDNSFEVRVVPLQTPVDAGKRRVAPEVEQSVRVARAFITKLARPASLSELLDEMARVGVPVGGKDPKATLDSRLRYSGEFKTGRGLGWWLAEQPYPNALAAVAHFSPERIA